MKSFQSKNLEFRDGIWMSASRHEVSYPAEAHHVLAEVESESFWFEHRNDLLLTILKPRIPKSGAFLDVGGGRGFVSLALQEQLGLNVVLIEPDEFAAKIAHARGVRDVICGLLNEVADELTNVGAVGLFDVLEHIEEPLPFLKVVHGTLAHDGLLVLNVPAHQWLWSAEDDFAGHYRRYTLETLTRELEISGFQLEFMSYCFSFLVPPLFLLRSVPSRIGIRTGDSNSGAGEHKVSGLTKTVIDSLRRWECDRFSAGRTISTGTSIMAVARKRHN